MEINNKEDFSTIDKCIEYLKNIGYIEYGSIIPTYVFEKLIGMDAAETWEFRGSYIALKDAIEKEGFFGTRRGMNSYDLKLLSPEEVWYHAKKRQETRKKIVSKDHLIVLKTDTSSLDEINKKFHFYELNRLALVKLRMEEV